MIIANLLAKEHEYIGEHGDGVRDVMAHRKELSGIGLECEIEHY